MSKQFIEPELEDWLAKPTRSGFIMGRPIPLVIVLIASAILLVLIYPKATLFLKPVGDCGDITVRPELKETEKPPLIHNTFCKMTGTVADLRVFSSGADHLEGPDYDRKILPPREAFADVRYFSKLTGDKVFVILDAAEESVYRHREKHEGDALFGYNVSHVGRVIDPTQASPSLKRIGRFMRRQFLVSAERPIRLFDTTDTPQKHLGHFVAFIVALFGNLLSIYGIFRLLRRKHG